MRIWPKRKKKGAPPTISVSSDDVFDVLGMVADVAWMIAIISDD
jgi:hypothetical protein